MGWGRPPSCVCGECKKCKHAAYMRGWYQRKTAEERRRWTALRDKERVRAADRARHQRMSGQLEYELRRQAGKILNDAIKRGDIVRKPCEVCGSTQRVDGHHDDYQKPLEVRWLCPMCHAAEHNKAAA